MGRRDLALVSAASRWTGWCERCQKDSYRSRKEARRADRRYGGTLNAYVCDPDAIFPVWHLGHLPVAVKQGRATRDEIYRKAA